MDLMINGKVVKKDYTTKCHHTRTDIYHFKCVPTMAGMIEVTIQGDPEVKGGREFMMGKRLLLPRSALLNAARGRLLNNLSCRTVPRNPPKP